jgi:2-iminobutanoate/2-iminopropanoate deaminase
MKITPIHPQEPKPEYRMPFVPAFAVDGARLVFVAGCGPIPPYHKHPHVPEEEARWMKGGMREQALQTFEHIRMVLAAAGADLSSIVKLTVYLSDIADQDVFNEVSAEMFGTERPPPRTVVQVTLNHVDMKLEVDAIAAVQADGATPAASPPPHLTL